MWVTEQLKRRTAAQAAAHGKVTIGGAEMAVLLRGEERGLPTVTPGGYCWRPRTGDSVLVMKEGENALCVAGVLAEPQGDLLPGEVRLRTDGGASLTLRSDGRIELCGEFYVNGEKYGTEDADGAETV